MARIVVAGSSDADRHAAYVVLNMIEKIKEPTVILRRGRETEPGPLEDEIALECRTEGIPIEWWVPAPGGREEVFWRDIDMVAKSDLVIAIFSPGRVMQGGTGHVVEKAIDRHVPAYAFSYNGGLERIGEYDPDDIWGSAIRG